MCREEGAYVLCTATLCDECNGNGCATGSSCVVYSTLLGTGACTSACFCDGTNHDRSGTRCQSDRAGNEESLLHTSPAPASVQALFTAGKAIRYLSCVSHGVLSHSHCAQTHAALLRRERCLDLPNVVTNKELHWFCALFVEIMCGHVGCFSLFIILYPLLRRFTWWYVTAVGPLREPMLLYHRQ